MATHLTTGPLWLIAHNLHVIQLSEQLTITENVELFKRDNSYRSTGTCYLDKFVMPRQTYSFTMIGKEFAINVKTTFMKYIILLTLTVFLSISSFATEPKDYPDFTLTVKFHPSFLAYCIVTISKHNDKKELSIIEIGGGGSNNLPLEQSDRKSANTLYTPISEKDILTDKNFDSFVKAISDIDLSTKKSLKNEVLDGITIDFNYTEENKSNAFSFRTPRKWDIQEHKIITAIFDLINMSVKQTETINYIELLEGYFDFGLSLKHISDSPLEYRMYGNLSSNEATELRQFLSKLPNDKPIIIDFRNFERMGGMFYPDFKELIMRNTNIYWLANEHSKMQLREIGISESRIYLDRNKLMEELK